MKKLMLLAATAALAFTFTACGGDDDGNGGGGKKNFEAAITLDEQLPSALVYGEPVNIKGSVETTKTLTKCVITAVTGTADNYVAAGEAQEFAITGSAIDALFFPDVKAMTAVEVVLYAGTLTSTTYYPVSGAPGEMKGDVWINRGASLNADAKVATADNDPENYPVAGTGAGSTTKSFFSMHGVTIGSTKEHLLSLNELRAVDGLNGSMCFLNCLQNTKNNAYIGGQRGYMFSSLKASAIGGGTTGRQCDIYEVDGHGIKDANIDIDFGFYAVPGSWKSGRSDEAVARFDAIDALFAKLPKSATTTLEKMRAFYAIGAMQRDLDNATLGVTEDPTSLPFTTYTRRWTDAGHSATKAPTEGFRTGDYIIFRSKRGTDPVVYYYGVAQIVNMFDDKDTFVPKAETDYSYIDQVLAETLFGKGVMLDIRTQCEL